MKSSDGKYYNADVTDIEGMFRIIESIPSKNAEPIKQCYVNLGKERIDEVFDPSLTMQRAIDTYRAKGYDEAWIFKRIKGIRKESLRDNMTDIEVLLTDLGEIATRDIATSEHPYGFKENMKVACRGGQVAKDARKSYEKATKKKAISNQNNLNYQYMEENKQIERL